MEQFSCGITLIVCFLSFSFSLSFFLSFSLFLSFSYPPIEDTLDFSHYQLKEDQVIQSAVVAPAKRFHFSLFLFFCILSFLEIKNTDLI